MTMLRNPCKHNLNAGGLNKSGRIIGLKPIFNNSKPTISQILASCCPCAPSLEQAPVVALTEVSIIATTCRGRNHGSSCTIDCQPQNFVGSHEKAALFRNYLQNKVVLVF